ncbi:MAG: hypothetical protein HYT12_01090 [Candidatus Liptonbacteria bacterium]|nr:hypothetical protein [Candidatus Liptonbacteria bacterium]
MSAYEEYLNHQRKLRRLIKDDQDKSKEGEQLREVMDDLWNKLTPKQQEEVNKNVGRRTIRFRLDMTYKEFEKKKDSFIRDLAKLLGVQPKDIKFHRALEIVKPKTPK